MLVPVAGFSSGIRPGPSTVPSLLSFWRPRDDDSWFLWHGPLAKGNYLLRFDGAVAGAPEKTAVKIYFAADPSGLSEARTLSFWPLGNNPLACRRELLLSFPEDVGVLRLDLLASARPFRFTHAELLRCEGEVPDAERPFQVGVGPSPRYAEDGLITQHNCDFVDDPRFVRAYQLGKETGSWHGSEVRWRAFVNCWAAERGGALEGDFVECGVNRGGFSRTVIDFIDFPKLGKRFYLLDTFQGIDERQVSDAERRNGILEYRYSECFQAVQETFAAFPSVQLIRGTVPDTLREVPSAKIAYLALDMNCAAPEIAAATYFWEKLSSGAVILLDDYGWDRHFEQKKAFDAFARERGVRVLALPTGQGIILKP